MNTKSFLVSALLSVLILAGCEKDKDPPTTVKGTGDLLEKTVDLPAFSRFRLSGFATVRIHTGAEQSVVLKAQQEILDVMTTEVRDGELLVGFSKNVSVDTDRDILVGIVIPLVRQIALDGTGLFELSGETQSELTIVVNGTGTISSYEMPAERCRIFISGTANCYVSVVTSLEVTISGIGNVFYRGDPVISSSIRGIGNVIDDN
jgi:hypothetical protein